MLFDSSVILGVVETTSSKNEVLSRNRVICCYLQLLWLTDLRPNKNGTLSWWLPVAQSVAFWRWSVHPSEGHKTQPFERIVQWTNNNREVHKFILRSSKWIAPSGLKITPHLSAIYETCGEVWASWGRHEQGFAQRTTEMPSMTWSESESMSDQ